MKRFDYVLFDLDGTLTDSCEGIAHAIQVALEEKGIIIEDRSTLYKYAGPPLYVMFREVAPQFTAQDIEDATMGYRRYYDAAGWKENAVYPGAKEMLQSLKQAGLALGTASSKPEIFVKRICDYFGLTKYLTYIAGADMEKGRFEKEMVLEDVLGRLPAGAKERTVLVGDRLYDVEGGHKMGLPVIGVSYGYGGREELAAADCDVIVDSFEELTAYLTEEV